MHGSLQIIYATEVDRGRRAAGDRARTAASVRRPFAAIRARVSARAAADDHGVPRVTRPPAGALR